jgi:hypothetical protein
MKLWGKIPGQRAQALTWMIMAFVLLAASGILFIRGWLGRGRGAAPLTGAA